MADRNGVEAIIRDRITTAAAEFHRSEFTPFTQTSYLRPPFIAAFVPAEVIRVAELERWFTQIIVSETKNIALEIARQRSGFSRSNYPLYGVVKRKRFIRIAEIIFQETHPNWERELNFVRVGRGQKIPVELYFDMYVEDHGTGRKYAFDLEPFPLNEIAIRKKKQKFLTLYSMSSMPVDEAHYVLPYQPPVQKSDLFARWFDMRNDAVVLIGEEFWNKIGGEGTYKAFIEAVNAIGDEYKEEIYREYLGIEPPPDAFNAKLR